MTHYLNGPDFCIYPGVSQYQGKHWLKQAMAWAYGVDYIHAWVGFRLGEVSWVYHSTGMGVHCLGWHSFLRQRTIKHMWEIQLKKERFLEFATEASNETGKKYSNRQLFGSALVKGLEILTLGKIQLKSYPSVFKPNREKEHVCSETAGRVVVKYTSADWEGRDPDLYTPKDFFDTCKSLQAKGEATVVV